MFHSVERAGDPWQRDDLQDRERLAPPAIRYESRGPKPARALLWMTSIQTLSGEEVEQGDRDRWEIEQDEFGKPLIRHRHPVGTIAAYVVRGADGAWTASCPSCGEKLRIPAPPQPRAQVSASRCRMAGAWSKGTRLLAWAVATSFAIAAAALMAGVALIARRR